MSVCRPVQVLTLLLFALPCFANAEQVSFSSESSISKDEFCTVIAFAVFLALFFLGLILRNKIAANKESISKLRKK